MAETNANVTVFDTDGTTRSVEVSKDNMLTELQTLVGGYIEMVRHHQAPNALKPDEIFIVNEEGLLHKLAPNPTVRGLVGNVVLMKDADFD